jgi:hypothetical protein
MSIMYRILWFLCLKFLRSLVRTYNCFLKRLLRQQENIKRYHLQSWKKVCQPHNFMSIGSVVDKKLWMFVYLENHCGSYRTNRGCGKMFYELSMSRKCYRHVKRNRDSHWQGPTNVNHVFLSFVINLSVMVGERGFGKIYG